MELSACIIAQNEADRIGACLQSLRGVADEILVLDGGSTDGTPQICRARGARVVEEPFRGHVAQKNRAVALARHDWILSLDADERLSPALAAALARLKATGPGDRRGFAVNRCTRYLGRWIRHGGWYPQWRVRLFHRAYAGWTGEDPHDRVTVDGPVGRLAGELEHDTYRSLSDHLRTLDRYTSTVAAARHARGEPFRLHRLLARPAWRFLRMYVLRRGFLDGRAGLVLAVMAAVYVFLKEAKLLELELAGGGRHGG